MDEPNTARARPWAPQAPSAPATEHRPVRSSARYPAREFASPANIERAVDTWGDTVLRLARCKMENEADAEDVLQTVFMKLCQCTKSFDSDEHVKAWLLRVTLTCCTDFYRTPWNKHRASLADADEALENSAATQSAPSVHDVAFADAESQVLAAVAQLPDKQRVAVHLYYFEGYSIKEIAQITSENPATVRSHMHRAREALKHLIGDHHA